MTKTIGWRKLKVEIAVVALLALTGLFDIYSTLRSKLFLYVEANPMFILLQSMWIVILIKIGIIVLLSYVLLKKPRWSMTKNIHLFFMLSIALMAILLQGVAGVSNLNIDNRVLDTVNEKHNATYVHINEVPDTHLEEFSLPEATRLKVYLAAQLLLLIYPTLMALLTFWVWERCDRCELS